MISLHKIVFSGRPACSRPTAVNMQDTARKLHAAMAAAAAAPAATAAAVTAAAIGFAEAMQAADIAANRAIGAAGAAAMRAAAPHRQGKGLRVLTHCNTGSLATVQYGTALGCLRALHGDGALERAYCTETRCDLPWMPCASVTRLQFVLCDLALSICGICCTSSAHTAQRRDACSPSTFARF